VKRIYLDHNATTPLRAEALRRWNEIAERHYGNREPWGRPNPADRFITDADLLNSVLDRLRADFDGLRLR
jgi:hypothetical protein